VDENKGKTGDKTILFINKYWGFHLENNKPFFFFSQHYFCDFWSFPSDYFSMVTYYLPVKDRAI